MPCILSYVLLEPKHDTVASGGKGLGNSSGVGRELNVESPCKFSEGISLRGTVLESVGSGAVEDLGEGSSGEDPRVAIGVGVSRVAADKDSRDRGSGISGVDGVLGAEDGVKNGNSGGNLEGGRGILAIGGVESIVESNKDGTILLTVGLLGDERSSPVGVKLGVDVSGGGRVGSGGGIVAHGGSKISTHDHCLLHGDTVPEEVGGANLLPQVAGVAIPSANNPVEVGLDGLPEAGGDIVLGRYARVGVSDQGNGTESRPIVLRAAPGAVKDGSVGDLELGLYADINSVVDGSLRLPSEDPLSVGLHGSLVGRIGGQGDDLERAHGERSVPHPVVVIVAPRGVVVRGSNNSSDLLDVDVVSEVSHHGFDLVRGERSGVSGVLENKAASWFVPLGVEAPWAILILEGGPAASRGWEEG